MINDRQEPTRYDDTKDTHRDVFISSTSKDLEEHRKSVIDAVWRAGMFPRAMESGTALPLNAVEYSLGMVNKAEIYLGVFGHRYGHIPKGDKISITEMEYRRAVEREIPILIFIMHEDHPIKASDKETGRAESKLKKLKKELMAEHVVGFFKSVEDLRGQVIQALHTPELKEYLAKIESKVEETRPDEDDAPKLPAPPEIYYHPPYIPGNPFIGRKAELAQLDDWDKSGDTMMVVDAIGGVGKSALTWSWVHEHKTDFDGIIWWSFYEGGATVGSFIRHALAYITKQDPDSLKDTTYKARAEGLLNALQTGRWLLVLDGFERVLVAYHRWNAAQMRDENVGENVGAQGLAPDVDTGGEGHSEADVRACTDPRDGDFLRKLVACGKSKVLISTRLMPRELCDIDEAIPGVRHKILNGLHPTDAAELMRNRGVKKADQRALDRFMKQFGYHSLLLKMVAGRIRSFRRAPGDFDNWYAARGKDLSLSELDIKQSRTHILEYAFDGLDDAKKQLLSRVAAFGDAVRYDTVVVFNPYQKPMPTKVNEPSPWDGDAEKAAYEAYQQALQEYKVYEKSPEYRAGLATFDSALTELEERGLLQWDRDHDRYDLHPVVRGYAFDRLEEGEKRQTYDRIRGHFESLPEEDVESAKELADLKQTMSIYNALVGAGRLDEAAGFYRRRLRDVLVYQIAAYHTMVELLSTLFPEGESDQLPALSSTNDQANILNEMGSAFYQLGQNERALALYGQLIKLTLDEKDAPRLGVGLRNHALPLESDNHPASAERAWEMALELATAAGDGDGIAWGHLALLGIYSDTGQWKKAEAEYAAFNENPPTYQTTLWQASAEKYRAKTLIYREMDASETLDKAWELAVEASDALSQRQIHQWRGEEALQKGEINAAAEHFQNAITMARQHGSSELANYEGCFARALVLGGEKKRARQIIGEALAQQYKEEFHDLYNSAAEVYLALGERETAREYAIKAYKWAWADGPPYVWWWDLERAKKMLDTLGEPYPDMPTFDESKVKKIPHEDEIRAFVEELKAKNKPDDR